MVIIVDTPFMTNEPFKFGHELKKNIFYHDAKILYVKQTI